MNNKTDILMLWILMIGLMICLAIIAGPVISHLEIAI